MQAAESLGASDARIFFRHLLPNAAGTVVVAATSLIGQIILIEASTEFFGFGVASLIRPTLGNLIAEAASSGMAPTASSTSAGGSGPRRAALLVILLVCINLVGDGLDPGSEPSGRAQVSACAGRIP